MVNKLLVLLGLLAGASAEIVGTYNVSVWAVPIPISVAKVMLPSHDTADFLDPNLDGTVTAIIEAGHQIDNGPPGLGILNNEEAKVQIPNVHRVKGSDQPFIYKSQIYTDNLLASASVYLVFGLHNTKERITPKDSSKALTFNYEVDGFFKVEDVRRRLVNGKSTGPDTQKDVYDWKTGANLPWFGEGLLCGKHTYDDTTYTYLTSDIALYPKGIKLDSTTLRIPSASGIHFVAPFKIEGPAKCDSFTN